MDYAIEIKDLSFYYKDGTRALDKLSLGFEKGKKIAILGPNGSGKTTLLLHFNGINTVQQGSVTVMGRAVHQSNQQWLRGKVGLVFQDPDDQIFSGTVWDDVAFGPINQGLRGEELNNRVNEALRIVRMKDLAHKAPYHLSYGQKKKVAIAGVLAMDPDMIVLDEPVAFLDPSGKRSLFSILDVLNQQGKTIILATHDVDLVVQWADQVVILTEGRVIAQGAPRLLSDPALVEEADLELPTASQIFLPYQELYQQKIPVTVEDAQAMIKQLLTR
ncbi:cobalt ABC transporter, ATPase subunit [Desulforamulus reducens MI-1]|uniref:ABC transporter ATP-binding protein n=1 Tax=Desulforamulus reducens (strain ATCC BAA-1160 / DSM 100696 / MI-1) TaxID=349161 RepID=A4J7M1_DESRM|nr:ATP-binding cassette domain-containing protein [Desulforamulus reducens]ABO51074.1 cobalt ABC transporter, ATPase subunit [Desulforamulus reducens MI-1]